MENHEGKITVIATKNRSTITIGLRHNDSHNNRTVRHGVNGKICQTELERVLLKSIIYVVATSPRHCQTSGDTFVSYSFLAIKQ